MSLMYKICIAAAVILSILLHPLGLAVSAVLPGIAASAGGVLLYLGGRKGKKKKDGGAEKTFMTEQKPDAEKIYRTVHTAVLVIDRNLDMLAAEERWDASHDAALAGNDAAGEQEIAVISDLLEASFSGDGQFALDRLEELKYYLHRRGIEVVEYTAENGSLFDKMPSAGGGTLTIRPALVKDGKLLKKGMAAG